MSIETTTLHQSKAAATGAGRKRIMVAGIGNVFLQDDGFGNAVVKKLLQKESVQNTEINEVGVGGLKLAYDLMKGYDGLILIDASSRGEAPGTLYVIEPEEKDVTADLDDGTFVDPHGGDPATVLRFIKALGAWPGRVLIVGCEPTATDDFKIGLSDPVLAAVDKAVDLVMDLIDEMNNN